MYGCEYVAPIRQEPRPPHPWEGQAGCRRPWHYPFSVSFCHMDTPTEASLVCSLWKLAIPRPYIIIVDTGSKPENLEKLQILRTDGVEVLSLPMHGFRHASEFVSVGCDVALAACRTDMMVFTHSDCFIRDRAVGRFFLERVSPRFPAVGYKMSPRAHPDCKWMLSHTLTGLHIPTCDRIGLTWSMRRCFAHLGTPYVTAGTVGVSWPDTESGFNYCLRDAGIKPFFIGEEANNVRHTDGLIDHCRSTTCSKLYSPGHHALVKSWLEPAHQEANARIAEWSGTPLAGEQRADGRFTRMVPLKRG